MKKLLVLLTVTAFLAVNVNAQSGTTSATPEAKKETPVAKTDAKATKSCCVKDNSACCKNNKDSKNCTAEQRAACAKAGASVGCGGHATKAEAAKDCGHGHATKAEAAETNEVKETKSGLK